MSDKQKNERMELDCRGMQERDRMAWVGVSAEQQQGGLGDERVHSLKRV